MANYSHSTRLFAATTLRNVLDTRDLSELFSELEAISHTMQVSLDGATDPWGIKVEGVEMYVYIFCIHTHEINTKLNYSKNVSLPTALQRSMAAEAEASREARAKAIAA